MFREREKKKRDEKRRKGSLDDRPAAKEKKKENEKVGRKTSAAAFGKQKNTEGKQKTRDAAIEAHDDEPSFVES